MKIIVSGKHVDIGENLKTYVETHLTESVEKFFDHPIEAQATLSKHGAVFRCDIHVHVSRGLTVRCHGEFEEGYKCIDQVIHKLNVQMGKYKKRLKNHQKDKGALIEFLNAQQYIIDASHINEKEDEHPAIIAEISAEIPTLSVGEAVMRMDLSDTPIIMFKNIKHGEFNVIYRRNDGNIGWMDPKQIPS